jgi:nitrogen-specific signal transduction histidine kinase
MSEDVSSSEMSGGASSGARIDSRLAHDLANVLAAALAAARIMQKKAESDETRELAEIVLRQLDRAVSSIHEASNAGSD